MRKDVVPMLLVVGEHDLPGRAALNEQFLKAMREVSQSHIQLLTVPGRDHVTLVMDMLRRQDPTKRAMVDFIRKFTKR